MCVFSFKVGDSLGVRAVAPAVAFSAKPEYAGRVFSERFSAVLADHVTHTSPHAGPFRREGYRRQRPRRPTNLVKRLGPRRHLPGL